MSHPCRILIVEDNDGIRDLVGSLLVEEGFIVLQARNSPEAKEQIKLDGFDCVIIDVTLPGDEDGFALAKRAGETPVGVILITGNPAYYERLETCGHAYLQKPFRLDDLLSLLDEVMTKTGRDCRHWHKRRHEEVVQPN